ncbi:MAG: hypothetical protein GXX96_09610 [Planctomycetaceae bacterium]|nr:hypothetical protein [Planctomycetaceae bacterium]
MPDPKDLKLGDKVRFISRPDEWSQPDYCIDSDDIVFMDRLIVRGYPARVCRIDEHGNPWIQVRLKSDFEYEHDTWSIMESSGWIKVVPRKASK